jgi:branched-chain amino acid transport system substrate-binding protein
MYRSGGSGSPTHSGKLRKLRHKMRLAVPRIRYQPRNFNLMTRSPTLRKRRSWVTAGMVLAGTALLASACSSSPGSSGSSTSTGGSTASSSSSGQAAGSAKGVTSSTITIGLITSETGLAQAAYIGVVASAQARIDAINAAGGIDGRQLKLDVVDDQSTPTGNASAAANLAGADVFGVIDVSSFAFGGAKALQQAGVPVTGGALDAGEWGTQPNTNMFSWTDPVDPSYPEYTYLGTLMKDLGATTVGGISFTDEPAGSGELNGMVSSSQALGLKKGYVDESLTYGQLNGSAVALSLKQSGTDGLYFPIDAGEIFQLLAAAKQAGVSIKASLLPSGYGQSLLKDASALSLGQGAYFLTSSAPVELQTTATKAFQAALAKYANYTGNPPDVGYYWGWLGADLMIKGLQMAGSNPTRTSFMTALHGVSSYNADGLLAQPADLTLANFGKAPAQKCTWVMQLEGSTFKPYPASGTPVCGGLLNK